ncbi:MULTISPECIES: hypothetical protein [Sphingobacterium]|uniref:hypothetical protein n=1 Tax=Sphingobacterium TaxID=28453 RepID=UPI00257D912A|nr:MULTISPECIES: hypothetical protein [Sphingobacterium]
MKLAFYLIVVIIAVFAYLQIRVAPKAEILPSFMTKDDVVENRNKPTINMIIRSRIAPPKASLSKLALDYSKIWAHLNYLFETNDVTTGKEFYTEDWFKFLSRRHPPLSKSVLSREDLSHNLIISSWSNDNLICIATDSAVLLNYHIEENKVKSELVTVAVVLLFQGDNWRLDGLKVIESKIVNPKIVL